ncbi:hypothetical protein L2E82_01707 [Cichorium intybus]|uniref:Uncharacterized protein n=1 Tax=Cichorium intybus TaxID=13427 RepID=A0ACB9GZM8_CICIN|nr:hypothetical protein L2E82_01707 [Cichorium intybus]
MCISSRDFLEYSGDDEVGMIHSDKISSEMRGEMIFLIEVLPVLPLSNKTSFCFFAYNQIETDGSRKVDRNCKEGRYTSGEGVEKNKCFFFSLQLTILILLRFSPPSSSSLSLS